MADATYDVGRIEATMDLDLSPFQAGLAAAKRDAAAAKTEIDAELATRAKLSADDTALRTTVAGDTALLGVLGARTVAPQIHAVTTGITAAQAKLTAIGAEVVHPVIAPVVVWDPSVLRYRVGPGQPGAGGFAAAPTGDGGGRGGFLGGVLAGLGAGGGGKGGAGLLASMGWGKGFLGMAGFGTLLGFAGLGPEHLAMTGLGLAGSAGGAAIGGGLLGLGTLGVAGVGMGTDMAGIGQAAGDIQNVVKAQNQLNQAIAVYGKNSRSAAQAQAQLNYTLGDFSPIARGAVLAAANTAQAFHQAFNAATGAAEKTGAQILNQAMQIGMQFLPLIGVYASQNLGIIKKDIQPLFTWLQNPGAGGGIGVFADLEHIFQGQLPTAIHAMTQGFELFARTVDIAARYTGRFLPILDKFLTKTNSKAGFARWATEIGHLVGDFRMWEHLVKAVAADIYQLFHNDVGTGASIVTTLTQMLNKLHAWETSTAGKNRLHDIFEAHKKEVLALLALLPGLLSTFGLIELTVAPALTTILTDVVKVVEAIAKWPVAGPVLAWGLAIGVIASKMKLIALAKGAKTAVAAVAGLATGLGTLAGKVGPAVAGLATGLGNLVGKVGPAVAGLLRIGGAEGTAAGGAWALNTALTAGALVGLVALGVGIYELYKHLGLFATAMIVAAVAVGGLTVAFAALDAVPIVAVIVGIIGALVLLGTGIYELATHWHTVWHDIKETVGHFAGFMLQDVVSPVVRMFLTFAVDIVKAAADAFGWVPGIGGKLKGALHAIEGFKASTDATMTRWSQDMYNLGNDAGQNLSDGMINGMQASLPKIMGVSTYIAASVIGAMRKGIQPGSPSRVTTKLGEQVGQGLALGMFNTADQVAAAARNLTALVPSSMTPGAGWGAGAMSAGRGSVTINAPIAPGAVVITGVAGSPAAISAAVRDGLEAALENVLSAHAAGVAPGSVL